MIEMRRVYNWKVFLSVTELALEGRVPPWCIAGRSRDLVFPHGQHI